MKLHDVVIQLVEKFGTAKERANASKIAKVMIAAVGNAEIPATKIDKVTYVGEQLEKFK